jgi:putative addiction module CopG family antidote
MNGTIDLGDQIEAFATEPVTEGRYPSRESIPRESMRLFEERERRLARADEAITRR